MKPFIKWMVGTLLIFAALSSAYHLYLKKNSRQILVAVDTSFAMRSVWHQVPQILKAIENQRYVKFCLITEKYRVHSWSPVLKLDRIEPYAPRDFSKLVGSERYREIEDSSQKYLITNLKGSELESFKGWTIINLAM